MKKKNVEQRSEKVEKPEQRVNYSNGTDPFLQVETEVREER